MYFQVCSNLAYPQHSGKRYRSFGPLVVDNMKEDYVLLGKLRKLQRVVHVLCALCALGFKKNGKVRKLERYMTQHPIPVWVLHHDIPNTNRTFRSRQRVHFDRLC